MLQSYLRLLFGIMLFSFYKLLYFFRIKFKSMPLISCGFKLSLKRNSKLLFGKKNRVRNNVTFNIGKCGVVTIGDNCFFNDNCSINCHLKIEIGDNLLCGQNVMFFDHDHDYRNDINNFKCEEIRVGDNVWIGSNSVVLKGVSIGNNVVIAAGTVVYQDIEDNTFVYQKRNTIVKKVGITKNQEGTL